MTWVCQLCVQPVWWLTTAGLAPTKNNLPPDNVKDWTANCGQVGQYQRWIVLCQHFTSRWLLTMQRVYGKYTVLLFERDVSWRNDSWDYKEDLELNKGALLLSGYWGFLWMKNWNLKCIFKKSLKLQIQIPALWSNFNLPLSFLHQIPKMPIKGRYSSYASKLEKSINIW